jgi:hypothetical protein
MALLNYYSQTKMAKGEAFGYKTAILHFAPYEYRVVKMFALKQLKGMEVVLNLV